MKENITRYLPHTTVVLVAIMLFSLHSGLLNKFSFDSEYANVQGIDYFAVPKSFLNLLEGKSIFDTWGGVQYGPRATWYLAHPAFSIFVASWFSFFPPWTSYWLFVIFSVAIMAYCGHLISKTTSVKANKNWAYFLAICGFPTYWMLYVGNMQAPLVLALTLVMVAIFEFTYSETEADVKAANQKLMAGLLISFFSKPIVLLMLPLLLFTKETRKTTLISLVIYAAVSFVFIVVPVLNPESIGWNKLMSVAFDFDFIKQNMNIYQNQYKLNEYMKDNSIHWLNLIAQSEYKFMHIDVFSLPVFVDTIAGKSISAGIYKIPIYISLFLSAGVALIQDKRIRLESTLLLVMAISLSFFLSYNTVWEYQFTTVLPVIAFMPVLRERNVFYKKYITLICIIGAFIYLPSFYFLVRGSDFSGNALSIIRFNRIIPALLLFIIIAWQVGIMVKRHAQFKQLSKFRIPENFPERLFFDN